MLQSPKVSEVLMGLILSKHYDHMSKVLGKNLGDCAASVVFLHGIRSWQASRVLTQQLHQEKVTSVCRDSMP